MRHFFQGMLGALVVLIAAAILVPQYQNYLASSQTGQWLYEIMPTVQSISSNALRLKSTSGAGVGVRKQTLPYHATVEIDANGIIFVKGGADGQLVTLIPQFSGGKVSWRCIGGSTHATLSCDNWHGP